MNAKNIAKITATKQGNLAVFSPYDPDFVSELKATVPAEARKWDGDHKCWIVKSEQGDVVVALLTKHYGNFVDGRASVAQQQVARDAAEDAALAAEMQKIVDSQKFVIEHQAEIEALIARLGAKVASYSFRSASHEKARFASDKALLRHALDNAKQSPESLVEVQVRGLASVARRWELPTYDRDSFWRGL